MFCIVYPLRRQGQKLPRDAVREGGRRGWLTFTKMPAGQPVMIARLSGPNGGEVYPQLTSAAISTIDRGILIRGFVQHGSEYERQAWWCEPTFAQGLQPPMHPSPGPGHRG